MGTTLANLHVLGGDEQQLSTLLPEAVVGCWSMQFVSVYSRGFVPAHSQRTAKALSKKLTQPVLVAWLFDSDAVGFAVYQGGKAVVEHIMNPDGYSKMGNIALFCESLRLPDEDVPRLRTVWKKGNAEEQLELTALLLGTPLYNDGEVLPEEQYSRDVEAVDRWIADHPEPPKIKNQTKAVLIQELKHFRLSAAYCSAEPYDDEYVYDKIQFWTPNADGTLRPGWSTEEDLYFKTAKGRILGIDYFGGIVAFDSFELLPKGYPSKGHPHFLPDGGLLWQDNPSSGYDTTVTFLRCAPDGSEMWRKIGKYPMENCFAFESEEIIFASESDGTLWLERVDGLKGVIIEKLPRPFGLNVWSKAYHNGFWWVAHDGRFLRDGEWSNYRHALTKLDGTLRPLAELTLPTYTQGLFLSPDNDYMYIFFYQDQVMVVNMQNFTVVHVLNDKSYLEPLGFDSSGRFWLQRDGSTVEAWDTSLQSPISRHKLKGEIGAHHQDAQGAMCVAAWSKKERILRIYKLQ